MEVTTLDFETKSIEKRPKYPPEPVGVALRHPSGESEYLAWGHPVQNNCSVSHARKKLAEACRGTVVMHNASFDLDVLDTYFHLRPKAFHDTLYLAFLHEPRAETLSLKPMSERILGMPPVERDELNDWIRANIPKVREKDLGAHICDAPGELVGRYAIGDTSRTFKLFKKLYSDISMRGMLPAYQREIDLTWVTLEMERSGVRVDVEGLERAKHAFEKLERIILKNMRKRLGVSEDFNFNSPAQLGAALVSSGKMTAIIKTKTGKVSVKMDALHRVCSDKTLLRMLAVHSVVDKYLTAFIRPWLNMAHETGGRLLPTFNQVRGRDSRGGGGTRTGRYSSAEPNLQQVSSNVDESKNAETLRLLQKWLKEYCDFDFIGLRDYFLPDEGSVLIASDYDQQEVRLLGHFENGALCEAYRNDPKLDVHTFVQQLVKKAIGTEFPRKFIKVTNFGLIYGMGVDKLAAQLEVDSRIARQVRDGVLEALPGIKKLQRELAQLEEVGRPFRTWGGREYFTEEPKMVKGHMRQFGYKNLNTIIQGSAADVTKEGMLQVRRACPDARIAIQVHDELICMASSPEVAKKITEAMCDLRGLRVPMTSTPKISTHSWARAA